MTNVLLAHRANRIWLWSQVSAKRQHLFYFVFLREGDYSYYFRSRFSVIPPEKLLIRSRSLPQKRAANERAWTAGCGVRPPRASSGTMPSTPPTPNSSHTKLLPHICRACWGSLGGSCVHFWNLNVLLNISSKSHPIILLCSDEFYQTAVRGTLRDWQLVFKCAFNLLMGQQTCR